MDFRTLEMVQVVEFVYRYRDYDQPSFLESFRHPFLLIDRYRPGHPIDEDGSTLMDTAPRMVGITNARCGGTKAIFLEFTEVAGLYAIDPLPTQDGLRVTIGRSSNADIQIAHSSISRVHAVLRVGEDGHWLIEDSGSCNG